MSTSSPGIVPAQAPVIADLKGCDAWLAQASLADPRQACHELTTLLEELEDVPPPDHHFLDILERLREPISVAQVEHSKKFSGRPLPLRDFEAGAFDQVFDLWTTYGRAYRRLLRAAVEERAPGLVADTALLCERAIKCTAELITAHYRSRREVDSEVWQSLHGLYQLAEAEGVAKRQVAVHRRSDRTASPAQVYLRILLMELAHPYSLSARDLQWTRRWAGLWAHKVSLGLSLSQPQGYAVDLEGGAPPTWTQLASATPTTRFLDTTELRRSVKARIRKLESGGDPESLGLGKDVIQPDAARLLTQLYRAWVDAPVARQFTRRLVPGRTELVAGLDSIHVAVGGRAFKSAARHWDYSRRDAEQIAIYGSVSESGQDGPAGFSAEKWETLDESANGFRLRRKGPGERLSHHQLVALKPHGARSFILSEVRWLSVALDGSLTIGALALPGLADPVAARPAWSASDTPPSYVQAFLLSAMPGGSPSLVLPPGYFQPGRELEMRANETLKRVRLGALLQRGSDFDRGAFELLT